MPESCSGNKGKLLVLRPARVLARDIQGHMLDLVVQIVSFRDKGYLPNCLDSLIAELRDSGIAFEILVLENGSGEDLSDLQYRYKTEPITFHYSNKNLGFGAGHNLLSRKGTSSYLFALNPDTIISNGAIKTLFLFMETHTQAGLCGPRIEEPHDFWCHKDVFWPKEFIVRSFCEKFLGINTLTELSALEFNPILGAAFFFRRKAFDEVKGFDEKLFLYFEEGDIGNALKIKGWKIFFIYESMVTHLYNGRHYQVQNGRIYEESKRYFYEKWPHGTIK